VERTIALNTSEALEKAGARQYLLALVDWTLLVCVLLMFAFGVYSVWVNELGFLAGVAITVFGMCISIICALYYKLQRDAISIVRRRGGSPALFSFSSEGVKLSAASGVLNLAWSEVENILEFRGFSLVLFRGGGYLVLPIQDADSSVVSELRRWMYSPIRPKA
jgi:hypothetical protein